MSPAILPHFLRWLCEELVNLLLRGAWHFVLTREGAAQDSAFRRFTQLADAAPIWPCRVEWQHPRLALESGICRGPALLITSGRDSDDAAEFWEDGL